MRRCHLLLLRGPAAPQAAAPCRAWCACQMPAGRRRLQGPSQQSSAMPGLPACRQWVRAPRKVSTQHKLTASAVLGMPSQATTADGRTPECFRPARQPAASPSNSPTAHRAAACPASPNRAGSTVSTMGGAAASRARQMRHVPSNEADSSASGSQGWKSTKAVGPPWPTRTDTGRPGRPSPPCRGGVAPAGRVVLGCSRVGTARESSLAL